MRRRPTVLLLPLSATLLASCATPAPPPPPATVPAALLTCAADPPVPDVEAADWDVRVVEYVGELWAAGDDCRQRLGQVRAVLGP